MIYWSSIICTRISTTKDCRPLLPKDTIVVLDNAPTHTSRKFKEQLKIWEEKGLRIFFLPPYSPQLNPIEQLWKFMKYYWIELDAYKSVEKMKNYVENVIVEYGSKYEINFCWLLTFKYLNMQLDLDKEHYNQRSMVERVNKYLKDDFGCDKIYYQGATKVASVLAFGILSICIHQSLKLVT